MSGPKRLYSDEERISRHKERRLRIRENILTLFGRKCKNCGYCDDVRALQVDHIHRADVPRNHTARSGHGLYIRILSGLLSITDFQLLCANCNWLKKLDNNEHFPVATSNK